MNFRFHNSKVIFSSTRSSKWRFSYSYGSRRKLRGAKRNLHKDVNFDCEVSPKLSWIKCCNFSGLG